MKRFDGGEPDQKDEKQEKRRLEHRIVEDVPLIKSINYANSSPLPMTRSLILENSQISEQEAQIQSDTGFMSPDREVSLQLSEGTPEEEEFLLDDFENYHQNFSQEKENRTPYNSDVSYFEKQLTISHFESVGNRHSSPQIETGRFPEVEGRQEEGFQKIIMEQRDSECESQQGAKIQKLQAKFGNQTFGKKDDDDVQDNQKNSINNAVPEIKCVGQFFSIPEVEQTEFRAAEKHIKTNNQILSTNPDYSRKNKTQQSKKQSSIKLPAKKRVKRIEPQEPIIDKADEKPFQISPDRFLENTVSEQSETRLPVKWRVNTVRPQGSIVNSSRVDNSVNAEAADSQKSHQQNVLRSVSKRLSKSYGPFDSKSLLKAHKKKSMSKEKEVYTQFKPKKTKTQVLQEIAQEKQEKKLLKEVGTLGNNSSILNRQHFQSSFKSKNQSNQRKGQNPSRNKSEDRKAQELLKKTTSMCNVFEFAKLESHSQAMQNNLKEAQSEVTTLRIQRQTLKRKLLKCQALNRDLKQQIKNLKETSEEAEQSLNSLMEKGGRSSLQIDDEAIDRRRQSEESVSHRIGELEVAHVIETEKKETNRPRAADWIKFIFELFNKARHPEDGHYKCGKAFRRIKRKVKTPQLESWVETVYRNCGYQLNENETDSLYPNKGQIFSKEVGMQRIPESTNHIAISVPERAQIGQEAQHSMVEDSSPQIFGKQQQSLNQDSALTSSEQSELSPYIKMRNSNRTWKPREHHSQEGFLSENESRWIESGEEADVSELEETHTKKQFIERERKIIEDYLSSIKTPEVLFERYASKIQIQARQRTNSLFNGSSLGTEFGYSEELSLFLQRTMKSFAEIFRLRLTPQLNPQAKADSRRTISEQAVLTGCQAHKRVVAEAIERLSNKVEAIRHRFELGGITLSAEQFRLHDSLRQRLRGLVFRKQE